MKIIGGMTIGIAACLLPAMVLFASAEVRSGDEQGLMGTQVRVQAAALIRESQQIRQLTTKELFLREVRLAITKFVEKEQNIRDVELREQGSYYMEPTGDYLFPGGYTMYWKTWIIKTEKYECWVQTFSDIKGRYNLLYLRNSEKYDIEVKVCRAGR